MPGEKTQVQVPVRWSDMDAYAHVNNVQYLRYLEEARVMVFREWFGQDRSLLEEGVLVARCEIDYLAPLGYSGEPVLIDMWCSRISGASFDIAYVVHRDGVSYAHAETTLVTYDLVGEKPRRLGEPERAALERYRGEPMPLRSRSRDRG